MVTSGTFVTMKPKATFLPAGEFKAKCLAVLDEVERRHCTLGRDEARVTGGAGRCFAGCEGMRPPRDSGVRGGPVRSGRGSMGSE